MKKMFAFAIIALVAATAGFALTETATMDVTATLLPTVSITSTSLDFGEWFLGDDHKLATATITVRASGSLVYNITLDAGMNLGVGTQRNVANGASMVPYIIWNEDSTAEWGDADFAGTYLAGEAVAGLGTGTFQTFMANGELLTDFAADDSAVGDYTDVVVVTLNY